MGMAAEPGMMPADGGMMMPRDRAMMMPGDPGLMMQPDGDMMIPGDHTMGMPVGVDHYVDQYHHDMYVNSFANAEFIPVSMLWFGVINILVSSICQESSLSTYAGF